MLLIKSEKCKRIACFLLSVLLAFCIIISPICESRVYAAAGVVTVIGVGALLVIGTILVGLGVEVVDPGAFENLCKQVHEKLQSFAVVRDEIFLSIVEGRQYVENQLIVNIAKILFDLQVFTEIAETKTVDYLGSTIKVFDMAEEEALKKPVSYFGTVTNYDLVANLQKVYKYNFENSVFSLDITSDYWSQNPLSYISGINFYIDGNLYYGQRGGSLWGDIAFPIILNGYLVFPVTRMDAGMSKGFTLFFKPSNATSIDTSSGSICPDWGLSEKLPSISADTGAITFPADTPWAKNPAVSIPGISNPALPITVPTDLGGLKDMPQTDVMTGNPAGTANPPISIDKEIDKALEDMKMPPTLIEKFPFSIPFDIFRAMQGLVAPPVAPAFVIPLKAPAYGIDYEFRMDWSKFDIVISIVRWGTFLVFLLYLSGATKKLIWG